MIPDIHRAIWQGDLTAVKRLVEAGAEVDQPDRQGWSPLSRAIERCQPEIAHLLLAHSADVRAEDRRGRQALLWAAQYGPESVVEALIRGGADVTAADRNGKTPLIQAVRHRRTVIVAQLLGGTDWVARKRGYEWHQAIVLAMRDGQCETVAAFLDRSEYKEIMAYHWTGRYFDPPTLLMEAIAGGRREMIDLLLGRGVDVHQHCGRRSALTTALRKYGAQGAVTQRLLAYGLQIGLEEAVVANDLAIAERLLQEGTDVEMPDAEGQTLLLWAAEYGHGEMVRLLARYGADTTAHDPSSCNALMGAATRGDIALMDFLIRSGLDPNAPTPEWREPPLACAAQQGRLEATRWLVERYGLGPDYGAFAMDVASARGHREIVRLLLDAGADVNACIAYHDERTPLMWAALNGDMPLATLLLERGAAAQSRESLGYALAFAGWAGETQIIRLLLAYDPPAGKKSGALWGAAQTGHDAAAVALLEAGADPNETVYGGRTVLMWAAAKCGVGLIRKLLDCGAKVDAVDDARMTAFDWAAQAKRTAAMELLAFPELKSE